MHRDFHPDVVYEALLHEQAEIGTNPAAVLHGIRTTCNSFCKGTLQSAIGIKYAALLNILDQAQI